MVTIIVALISSTGIIVNTIINKRTDKKVTNLQEHILDADKTFLIDFLSDIENGIKKTEIQVKRAYEIYERYTKNGGNSYVHDKWEELKRKGFL